MNLLDKTNSEIIKYLTIYKGYSNMNKDEIIWICLWRAIAVEWPLNIIIGDEPIKCLLFLLVKGLQIDQ